MLCNTLLKNANITHRRPGGMWPNTSEFPSKDDSEIVFCTYSFPTFLCNFESVFVFSFLPREIFDIMYEDLLYSY